MSATQETKTIPEFVSELPDVDVSQRWERFWDILSAGKDKIAERFDVELHPSCEGREYYTSPDGSFEGSFNCYSGSEMEWLVHSWLGNRKNSLLDMNLTAFLGPQTTVPHLRIIFGTFPRIYFSADSCRGAICGRMKPTSIDTSARLTKIILDSRLTTDSTGS